MRSFFLISVITFASVCVKAQSVYTAASIPKELLPYASAVVRNEVITTEVKAVDNVIYHVKRAVTILNNNGDDEAEINVFYDKANSVKDIRGVVYDEFGKQVSKITAGNFQDQSAASDFSLFEDSRVKHFQPPSTIYPYTVEYEYETRSRQSLNFHDWHPVRSTGVAVEKSTFIISSKPGFNIRYKETNTPGAAVITSGEGESKIYTWTAVGIKAVRSEPYSPDPDLYRISIKIAPEKFSYGGMEGTYTNWNDLGKWVYDKLLKGRQELQPETVSLIKQLTADVKDPKDKARKIYEYMQKKTHYISVQIGIGGYQPFLASEVDKLNYGDCKALVNYMQALLATVNIDSWYCAVASGYNYKSSLIPDFASMGQANHVILCIPFANDTTWLECTSQKIPFGFLSNFTDDRNVLACTPTGGKLLRTPKYTSTNNLQVRKAGFNINDKGELSGQIETLFSGTQYDNREELIDKSETEKLKRVVRIYTINNLDIKQYGLTQNKTDKPLTTETLKFSAPSYASVSESKIYFLLNAANRSNRTPAELRNRTTDVYINDGYADEDEIVYTLPSDSYRTEKTPLNITFNKPFGSYSATMQLKGNQLIYRRKIQLLAGTYDKALYADLVEFFRKVGDADAYSVALVKK
jgi:transglutaminase-like putative cysteine protease